MIRLSVWNTPARYGLVAMALHWTIAVLILGMLALGMYMVDLDPGTSKFELFQLHKSVGLTILALSVLRLAWRLVNTVPPLPATLRPWEAMIARATHVGLYVLMIGIPISGWMMVSASPFNVPTVLFGAIHVPHLPILSTLADKKPVFEALEEAHELLAWGMIALFVLHVVGALKHLLILRDGVLGRMLPFGAATDRRAP